MNKLIAYLYLIRTFEVMLISGTGSMTLLMLGVTDFVRISQLFGILFFGAAGVLTWNDTLDILEDTVAHPERPIISGDVGVAEARVLGTVLLTISIVLSWNFNVNSALMGLIGIAVAIGYSFTSKSRFLLIAPMKNLVVSGVTALFMTFLPFALSLSASGIYYLFVLSLTLILFGYEILKDIRDVEGDRVAGYQTLPLRHGIIKAADTAAIFFAVSCVIMSVGFYIVGFYIEGTISLITTVFVLLPFGYLRKNPDPYTSDKTRYSVVFILLVSLGVIAILLYLRFVKL